jgi:LysM repeat protein
MRRLPARLAGSALLAFALLAILATAEGARTAVAESDQAYVVQPGDTLSGIAARFGVGVTAIAQANGIVNPSLIYVGQRIVIPRAGAAADLPFPGASPVTLTGERRDMHVMTIGHSVLGRPLHVQCTGRGDRVVLLVGGIHTGHEANTVSLVAGLAAQARGGQLDIPDGIWLCFLPALNPDGLALGIHTNVHRVDLNRNWPSENWRQNAFHPVRGTAFGGWVPLSAPETRALYDFVRLAEPSLVITWHCCADVVDGNGLPLANTLARRYAEAAGSTYIDHWTAYEVTGDFISALAELGIPAMDVELERPGAVPLAQHRVAVETVLAALAAP